MNIQDLLKKYGSTAKIPEAELTEIGYERIRSEGGTILRPIRRNEEDPIVQLRKETARWHGLDDLPTKLSRQYLFRMRAVIGRLTRLAESTQRSFADMPEEQADQALEAMENYRIPAGFPLPSLKGDGEGLDLSAPYLRLVQAWSKDNPASFWSTFGPHLKFQHIMAWLEADLVVWEKGIEPWTVSPEGDTIETETEKVARNMREIRTAFASFIGGELQNPKGCLQELAAKLKANEPTVEAILQAASADLASLRLLLSICLKRGAQLKDESRNVGLFHLKRVNERLSPRAESGAGDFVIELASKNPLTDLDIGNDGGACIGIFVEGAQVKGLGIEFMPRFLLDPATQFVAIRRGSERIGMALCFMGKRQGKPVLLINSIELNVKVADVAAMLSETMIQWINTWGDRIGVSDVVMGVHSYNTAVMYGKHENLAADPSMTDIEVLECHPELENVHGDPWFFGDIFPVTEDVETSTIEYPRVYNVASVNVASVRIEPKPAVFASELERWEYFFETLGSSIQITVGPSELQKQDPRFKSLFFSTIDMDPDFAEEYVEEILKALHVARPVGGVVPAIYMLFPDHLDEPPLNISLDWPWLESQIRETYNRAEESKTLVNFSQLPELLAPKGIGSAGARVYALLWAHHLGASIPDHVERVTTYPVSDSLKTGKAELSYVQGVVTLRELPKAAKKKKSR